MLGLPEFRVLQKKEQDNSVLFVVEKKSYYPACPECGSVTVNKHAKIVRHARDLNWFDKHCELAIEGNRYKCTDCDKTFTTEYTSVDSRCKVTNRLKSRIQEETLKKPFKHIAEQYSISNATVRRFFEEFVEKKEAEYKIKAPRVLGMDEAHLNKEMRGVFTDIENRMVINILPKRTKDTVIDFIYSLPGYEKIEVVTIDMHRPYKEAVIFVLPKTKIVIDRFHVIQLVTKALERIRVNLGKDVSKTDRRYLINSRFMLLKNRENLKIGDYEKLNLLFEMYPNYGVAYNLKESFRKIYDCNNKEDAIRTFKEWCESIPDKMPEFKDVVKTINKWSAEIFNYFEHRYTNAYTESLNNLIKEIEKRGRGYSFEALRAKVLFGTTATKPPKYSRPEREIAQSKPGGFGDIGYCNIGFDNLFGEYEKPILVKGSGVDINELIEIMESGAF